MTGRGTLIVGAAPAAGGADHYAGLIARAKTVVAADGGLLTVLAAGRVPDVCVGDFDSTPPQALAQAAEAGSAIIRYPTAKDLSDLDLALEVARERGDAPVVVCAAFTGRIDHTLAAFGTLLSGADLGAYADEPEWFAVPLDSLARPSCRLEVPPGVVVSILAFGGPATVSAEGFEYALDRTSLEASSSLGLSNVTGMSSQSVLAHDGRVLVIVNRRSDALTLQPPLASTDIL